MTYAYLILGGGVAALSAAEAIRARDPQTPIAMVSEETMPPYSRPMLTKLPLRHYRVEDTLVHSAQWYEEMGISLLLNTKVLSMDAAAHTVTTDRGVIGYGRCVYALGAYNFIPPFSGRDLPGVYNLRRWEDASALRRRGLTATHAAIIGGGVIGLEAAYLLSEQGLKVTVIETAPYLMPRLLDEASSNYLRQSMTQFQVITGAKVLGITGATGAEAVEIEGMEPVKAQLVLISCGVRANVAVAQAAGAAVERAVVVNARMETSLPDVYACGDCAQFEGMNSALWAQAVEEGRVAGDQAAGGDAIYDGSDTALVLSCSAFSLYSQGDLGKNPAQHYTVHVTQETCPPAFSINPQPKTCYVKDFYADGRLVGTFMLGNLRQMGEKKEELLGGAP